MREKLEKRTTGQVAVFAVAMATKVVGVRLIVLSPQKTSRSCLS